MRLTIYLEEHGDETATASFDLTKYGQQHKAEELVAAGLRNMLRDQRALSYEPLKAYKAALKSGRVDALNEACAAVELPEGSSEEAVAAACKTAWVKAARQRLLGWMKDGYRPGGGGVSVSEWVKLARVKLAAHFAKKGVKGEAKLNGLTLAEVKRASEAELREYVGAKVAAKWDADLADDLAL